MDCTLLIFSRAAFSASFLEASCSRLIEFLILVTVILSDYLLPVFLAQLVPDRPEAICHCHHLTVVPNTVPGSWLTFNGWLCEFVELKNLGFIGEKTEVDTE